MYGQMRACSKDSTAYRRSGFGTTIWIASLIATILWSSAVMAQDDAVAAAIAKIEAAGGTVRQIAMSVESKEVSFHLSDKPVTDEALAPLSEIPSLVWLYLQGTEITDEGLRHLAGLSELTKLHLEKTGITDAGLAHLTGLSKLEYLNLYGTKVTDAGVEHLSKLSGLKKLYLWQTGVTEEGVAKLQAALPEAEIVLAAKLAEPQPEPAAEESEKPADEPENEPKPEENAKPSDEPAKETLAKGQFARVRLTGDNKILSLAEVQVLQTGDNAPLHTAGKAMQSSVDYAGDPARAIDGNTSQNYSDGSITHTAAEKDPWWQVDLGAVKDIGRIIVWNRGDCCGERLEGAVVEVLNESQEVVWSEKISEAKNGSVHAFAK